MTTFRFRDSDEKLLGKDSGTGTAESMEDVMDVHEVLPDEGADARFVRNGVEAAIRCLIARGRPLDATVIHIRPGNIRDLRLQDEGHIFVKVGTSISSALRQASKARQC